MYLESYKFNKSKRAQSIYINVSPLFTQLLTKPYIICRLFIYEMQKDEIRLLL